jgi:hypothetical protein
MSAAARLDLSPSLQDEQHSDSYEPQTTDGPVRFTRGDIAAWLERARQGWLPGESAPSAARRAARVRPSGRLS